MRRLALVLLLVLPGVVVVWAGLRDNGARVEEVGLSVSSGISSGPELEPGQLYVFHSGDLLGRVARPLQLEFGDPPVHVVFVEGE